MNQPTAIIVTEYVGRPRNPYSEVCGYENIGETEAQFKIRQQNYDDFEATVQYHPCPTIANTEPGETILAEIKYQGYHRSSAHWSDITKEVYERWLREHEPKIIWNVRQIWVPIVEQKEGEWKIKGELMGINGKKYPMVEVRRQNGLKRDIIELVLNIASPDDDCMLSDFLMALQYVLDKHLPSPPITER